MVGAPLDRGGDRAPAAVVGHRPRPDDRGVFDAGRLGAGAEGVDEELGDVGGGDPHGAEPGRDRLAGQPLGLHRLERGDVRGVAGVGVGERADLTEAFTDVAGQVVHGGLPVVGVVVGAEDQPGAGQLGEGRLRVAGQQVGDHLQVDPAGRGERRGERLDRGVGAVVAALRGRQPVLEDRRLRRLLGGLVELFERRDETPAGVVAEPLRARPAGVVPTSSRGWR